jgi:hypothetical protein
LNFSTRISTLSHKTTSLNRFYCCFCFCFLFFSCLFPSRQHSKRAFFGFEICLYINLGLLSFTRADKPLSEIASLLVASEPLVRSLDGFDHSTAAGSGTSASVFFGCISDNICRDSSTSSLLCTSTYIVFSFHLPLLPLFIISFFWVKDKRNNAAMHPGLGCDRDRIPSILIPHFL